MPHMRFAVLLLLVMANAGISVRADMISQDDFLERLKQTHPLFIKEGLAAQIDQQERASYLGDQDWLLQSSFFVSHEEPAIAIGGPEKADGLMFAGGVRRLLWRTGGVLSASFSSGYANLELDPWLGVPDSYFQQRFNVAYSHPLLRNKHGVLDRLQYNLKQFDIDISEVIALENEEDFLIQAAARFLDWVLLTEQRRIVTERLSLSEVELSRTREKRNANLIDEVDVIRAEDAVRIARQNQLLVESQWLALQSELAVLAQDSSYYDAAPEYELYQPKTFLSRDEAFAQLEAESRLLSSLTIRIEQLQVVRSGFAELRKADLSLVAQLGLEKADPGFGPSLVMNRPDARIGFQLAFPIGHRTAKAKVAQTDLQILQLEKQREELSLDLFSAVANVLTQAGQLETVLELNREQIESAKRKTQEELRLYDLGRGELTFVIQSRDSEQAAQLTYAVNALNYQKLFLEYRALMDQLHR